MSRWEPAFSRKIAVAIGVRNEGPVSGYDRLSVRITLKGSLFDLVPLGTVELEAMPEVGDVVDLHGKGYTVVDVIAEVEGLEPTVIVEPVAVSQRRGQLKRA